MKYILLVVLCSCGVEGVVSEDTPPEEKELKTCEYVVSGLCVNTNGHDIDISMVQGVLDTVYDLYSEEFGEFDYVELFSQNEVSVDFVSGEEIGYFCTTSKYGCALFPVNSVYVRVEEQDKPDWLEECRTPGDFLGHELLHVFNKYFYGAGWQEDMNHTTPGLFIGEDSVAGRYLDAIHTWCYEEFQGGYENGF